MPARENKGFFTKPRTVNGFVIKNYQGWLSEKEARELVSQHEQYLDSLRKAGIVIPITEMQYEIMAEGCRVRIVQEAFKENELVRSIVEKAPREQAVDAVGRVLQAAGNGIIYQTSVDKNFGFHPSLRNFALRGKTLYYLDTFPPMVSRKQTVQTIRKHAPWPRSKLARTALIPIASLAAIEYYKPEKMISGIATSAARLRPELKKEFVELAVQTSVRVLPKKAGKIRKKVVASVERKGYRKITDFAKRFARRVRK